MMGIILCCIIIFTIYQLLLLEMASIAFPFALINIFYHNTLWTVALLRLIPISIAIIAIAIRMTFAQRI